MTRDRRGEHARLEHAMVQAALGNSPVPPIPPQSNGNRPRIYRQGASGVSRRAPDLERTTGLVGPNTPLFTVTQFVILREAQKIREIPDYRPDGWMTVLEWATRIEDDSTYRWQHRPEAFEVGEAVYRQLRKEHFGEQYTNICPKSETAKFRHLTAGFCTGIGVDIGAGGDSVVPSAICVDLPRSRCPAMGSSPVHLPIDCRKLSAIFADESLDYIYTSHLLEDFTWDEAKRLLGLWADLLKPGGYFVILVPEGSLWRRAVENGHPPNFNHKHEFTRGELTEYFSHDSEWTHFRHKMRRFEVLTESIPDPADYSILFVAKRKADV